MVVSLGTTFLQLMLLVREKTKSEAGWRMLNIPPKNKFATTKLISIFVLIKLVVPCQ